MSLATRCPACGTIFRVVQDQLKVSEGWVRCGQCHEVFHGIESLFDLDSDPTLAARRAARQAVGGAGFSPTQPPPLTPPPAPPPSPALPNDAIDPLSWPDAPTETPEPVPAPLPEPAPFPAAALAPPPTPPVLPSHDDAPESDHGPETLASLLPEPVGDWPPRRRSSRPVRPVAADDPRFLREAHRVARWNKPWVRGVLGGLAIILGALAAGQAAYPLRDLIAARWPASQPAWAWLCAQAGCALEAPRLLSSLTLDGSSLVRTESDHVLMFSADLRNRAEHPVRMPAFDLKFTDLNGQVVARKVFEPAQLGITQAALGAEAELHLHVRLHVDDLEVSGFQAEVFYP